MRKLMKTKIAIAGVKISVALFVISLTQISFYTGVGTSQHSFARGIELLLIGWMGLLAYVFNWLANPALLLAYIFVFKRKYEHATISSLVSVYFAASFLTRETISAGGDGETITGYGSGYWLWLASAIIMTISSFYLTYLSNREALTAIDNSSKKLEEQMLNRGNDEDGNQRKEVNTIPSPRGRGTTRHADQMTKQG